MVATALESALSIGGDPLTPNLTTLYGLHSQYGMMQHATLRCALAILHETGQAQPDVAVGVLRNPIDRARSLLAYPYFIKSGVTANLTLTHFLRLVRRGRHQRPPWPSKLAEHFGHYAYWYATQSSMLARTGAGTLPLVLLRYENLNSTLLPLLQKWGAADAARRVEQRWRASPDSHELSVEARLELCQTFAADFSPYP